MTTLKDYLVDLASEVEKITLTNSELNGEEEQAMKKQLIEESIEETLENIKASLVRLTG